MKNTSTKKTNHSIEQKSLIFLSVIFIGVMLSAWIYSMNLKQSLTTGHDVVNVDVKALVEVEKMRNLAESQISNSLTFFLMGSTTLFDEQKKDKQIFADSLANFEKNHSLSQIPEIAKRITLLQQQQQEFFDQAMEFRAKQTESKIVGQFYRSKTAPIKTEINKSLDEIVQLHKAEFERAEAQAQEAAAGAEVQIPRGMTIFTALLGMLFLGMALLVLRMTNERKRQLAERTRLYDEAKKATLAKDEVIAAISQDLKEPLAVISQTTESIKGSAVEGAELVRSSVHVIEDRINDILDQTKADAGTMTLRLDQLGIDSILDDARLMLQPLAKQQDIRLEFNTVNPPVLAFMDRERVMRVLSNLIGNAIKFSPKQSKIVVKVRSDQQFVYISIKDSGPGIPEKQLKEIFNHFWQARKTAAQGPGIGLAIVKTIIEAHGGIVSVESHMGHGSTFTFSLPRRRPVGAHLGKSNAPAVRQNTRPQWHSELREEPNV